MTKLILPQTSERGFPTLFDSNWIEELYKSFDRNINTAFGSNTFPKHDVIELRKNGKTVATRLRFALGGTGYNKENVIVRVEEDKLLVQSSDNETLNQKEDEFEEIYLYNGIAKRSFKQEYTLNSKLVDVNNVTAEFKDGTLIIDLPHKKEEAKIGYQVNIK